MDDLTLQVEELKMSIDGLEKERDFYFAKLRDIEVINSLILDATIKRFEFIFPSVQNDSD